ncbi:SRPBCC domain-containing protein [Gilvibacter sediminis]|uniref:SRPBCC domain-containing protein n=1 Tax=Gilvibacter sediminis TaxID=379071 RepID=UPI00235059BB|nr:SRPBCC domain-containing protein [Gilvibacter sediminis]MDC7998394.1 SRPBCC domain-containing protein [Gilvibacter sediminis]
MITTILIATGIGILVALLILVFKLPTKIQYVEEIRVNAPVKKVYDAVRFQEQLMDWSAWPSETNSQCAVKNVDGQIGAQTVYLQKGKQFGYQEVTELVENEKVSFYLTSKAPFEQHTKMHFYLRPINENQTNVSLYFDNTLKRPSHVFPHIFGIINWTHKMHLKDLAGLKEYVEKEQ